jgi:hypothetical protein
LAVEAGFAVCPGGTKLTLAVAGVAADPPPPEEVGTAGVMAVEALEVADTPIAFEALTENVYATPLVRPVTVRYVLKFVPLYAAGLETTEYEVTALPPFEAGAVQETYAKAFPAVAVTPVGAPGAPIGVTAVEALDVAEVPTVFTAETVNVYAVSLVSPVAVTEVDVPVVLLYPAGLETTLYAVIASPPVEAGAVHETVAVALPATALTLVGAPGTVAGVTAADAVEEAEVPLAFVAET